jgi:peptide/nickel transport system substrate-binding protein
MRRHHFLYGAASALAAPAVHAQSSREQTLKLVPLTSLYSLDTIFNTSLVTTNHGWAVYDSLFGMNNKGEVKPQMTEAIPCPTMEGSTRSRCARV